MVPLNIYKKKKKTATRRVLWTREAKVPIKFQGCYIIIRNVKSKNFFFKLDS